MLSVKIGLSTIFGSTAYYMLLIPMHAPLLCTHICLQNNNTHHKRSLHTKSNFSDILSRRQKNRLEATKMNHKSVSYMIFSYGII